LDFSKLLHAWAATGFLFRFLREIRALMVELKNFFGNPRAVWSLLWIQHRSSDFELVDLQRDGVVEMVRHLQATLNNETPL
jgi:hypothetical protein